MFSSALKDASQVFTVPPTWIPNPALWENLYNAWTEMPFSLWLYNTVVKYAIPVTIGTVISACVVAYGFARLDWRLRDPFFAICLATMMVPGQVTMMPVFMLLKELHLLNAYTGLILPGAASVFAIFLIKQFMEALPDELLEAARIDGCSELGIFFRIVLPLSKPVLATVALFTFMGAWNEFLWALIVMLDEAKYTLPVALANLNGQHNTDWGLLMAGSVVVILPVVLIFLVMQRFYVRGITMSGLKG